MDPNYDYPERWEREEEEDIDQLEHELEEEEKYWREVYQRVFEGR